MLSRKVAICGVAQVPFHGNLWWQRFQEMAFACVEQIVAKTGVTFDADGGIGTVVTCSDDVFDARTISDNAMTDAVGAHFRGEEKVAMDGLNAVGYALATILSGHEDVVLVVGHGKESQAESRWQCTNLAFDPFYTRPLGLDYLSAAALQARAYMAASDVTDAHLAAVVAHSRSAAAGNPDAQLRTAVSAADVMASPMACDPLRELHVYPVSDGAVAMLLACEERAAAFTDRPVWITGFANAMDRFFLGDRDLGAMPALQRAAFRALTMAGVSDPAAALDVLEINAPFAHQLPMALEALGVAPPGGAGAFIDGGGLARHHVNPSGGMLAGNPIFLGGMARAMEGVLQLSGQAGPRQVKGARRALAHGTTGPAAQHHAVMILEASA